MVVYSHYFIPLDAGTICAELLPHWFQLFSVMDGTKHHTSFIDFGEGQSNVFDVGTC